MIDLSHAMPVNPPGERVQLTRDDVWQGLLWKAEAPMPFVPAILDCAVLETYDDGFLREILHVAPGEPEKIQERVILDPNNSVTFIRLNGGVGGRIVNSIESGEDGEIYLRFHFTLGIDGVAHRSDEELEYERNFSAGYQSGAQTTLAAVRTFIESGETPSARHRAVAPAGD
ncbi:MAG: SRPBCC family protein [Solirubrobacteraceae bacterium]|nr:SRPBCC family protein [Solirubrobacteraceae bacterium]